MQKNFKFAVWFALVFVMISVSAQARSLGFVVPLKEKLSQHIHQTIKLEDLAHALADLRQYKDWPATMDETLKLHVAVEWFDRHHFKAATDVFLSLHQLTDYLDLLVYYRTLALITIGRASECESSIAKLEGLHPNDFDVLYLKSIYLAETGDLIGSLDVLNKLAKHYKRVGKVYLQRGLMYVLSLSHDLAIEDLKKAIRYLPKSEIYERQQVYLQLGLIYFNVKLDQQKAAEYFKKGIELDPQSELVLQVQRTLSTQ